VTVTVSAADGMAQDGSGPLRIDFAAVAMTRDTTMAIESTTVVNSNGQILSIAALAFGGRTPAGIRDEAESALTAGLAVNGHLLFDVAPAGNPATLDRLTLELTELGVTHTIGFAHIPYGPDPAPATDCEERLPCQWHSGEADVTLTLEAVAPLYWNRGHRTAIDWSLSSTSAMTLLSLPGGQAIARDGESKEVYGRELAGTGSRDDVPLTHAVNAFEPLNGRLVLRRPPDEDQPGFTRIELPLRQQLALRQPRWRPAFLNVPLSP